MKIVVAGQDRTAEWGPALAEDAKRRARDPRCAFLDWSVNALSLRDAHDEADYLDRLIRLARAKNHVDTLEFDIPRRRGLPGAILALFKKALWKLLRYQHDRMTFRQNLVNSNLMDLIEFQRAELRRLSDRLTEAERRPRS